MTREEVEKIVLEALSKLNKNTFIEPPKPKEYWIRPSVLGISGVISEDFISTSPREDFIHVVVLGPGEKVFNTDKFFDLHSIILGIYGEGSRRKYVKDFFEGEMP